MSRTSRRGWSLVELLVALAVVAVLVALLIPAVQMARESARRMQCSNHLKQLAMAVQQFHEAYQRFPPGYLGNGVPPEAPVRPGWHEPARYDAPWVGSLVYLLPYLEQSGLAEQVYVDLRVDQFYHGAATAGQLAGTPWWRERRTWQVAQTSLQVMLCPSTDPFQNVMGTAVALHCYGPRGGETGVLQMAYYQIGYGGQALGRTNYVPVAGGLGTIPGNAWDRWRGIFGNRTQHRFQEIQDGTSYTMLIGETVGGRSMDGRSLDFAHSWFGSGALPTAWGLRWKDARGNEHWQRWFQFSSDHSQCVLFAFADGAVRKINADIPRSVLVRISGMRDGAIVGSTDGPDY